MERKYALCTSQLSVKGGDNTEKAEKSWKSWKSTKCFLNAQSFQSLFLTQSFENKIKQK